MAKSSPAVDSFDVCSPTQSPESLKLDFIFFTFLILASVSATPEINVDVTRATEILPLLLLLFM